MDNLAETLLHALKAAGARCVFGLPGDYALPFFQVMEQSRILPLYTLSHEPGIGFAADGAARYGGGIGVAAATYGAGAMNLVNTVACAWAEHAPLVIVSGAPGVRELDLGLMLHHQIRTPETQMDVFREFTCDQARLDDPAEAPAQIARVLHHCLKRSRPAYIELPRDMVFTACEGAGEAFTRIPPPPPSLLAECLADIGGKLASARRPVILAGALLRRFGLEDTVYALASRWQIPLLTSFMGKGLFADKGWPHAGAYLGLAGDDALRSTVEDADFVLCLGVIPSDTNWGVSGRRVDFRHTIMATAEGVTVYGKRYPGLSLSALAPELARLAPPAAPPPHVEPAEPAQQPRAARKDTPLTADAIAPLLQAAIKSADLRPPIVADVGDCLFAAMNLQRLPLLASAYYATMGYSVPAALGLQAATGERPIVLVGDGGFQMTGWELLNCPRYGWDPIVIVFNNSSWEMLRQFQPDTEYTRIAPLSYSQIATALGGEARVARTEEELTEALRQAFARRGAFWIIEAMLQPGDCTTTMKRFTSIIKNKIATTI